MCPDASDKWIAQHATEEEKLEIKRWRQRLQRDRRRAKEEKKRAALKLFWDGFESLPRGEKLNRLRHMARLQIDLSSSKMLAIKRGQFLRLKIKLARLCKVCGDLATVRHHILQLQFGGQNHRRNLIPLCALCHAEIHPWLKHPAESAA